MNDVNTELTTYVAVLNAIKEKITKARSKIVSYANYELLKIYWEIGDTINLQEIEGGWGAKIVEQLARDLKIGFSEMKGLSARNLRYMREFAKAYPDFLILQHPAAKLENKDNQQFIILQHPAAKLPWAHHQIILDKVKSHDERIYYVKKTAENNWSRNVLGLQIEGKLYQREGKSLSNFKTTLEFSQADLAQETFKNPYLFDFINIGNEAKERDIENALIEHLKKFLLELGRGFAYVGNQYNLEVAGDDFFLDLFFYNTRLHCYVIFELKVGEFKPEFAGKLNFYINAVDEQIKSIEDKPTIGVLLCKSPNETIVKYSLKGIDAPIGVSDYELTAALPKEFKGQIPTIQELEQEIETEYEELKSPAEKRMDSLKQKLSDLKNEEIQTPATHEIILDLYINSVKPLFTELLNRLEPLKKDFVSNRIYWTGDGNMYTTFNDLESMWFNQDHKKLNYSLNFSYSLIGLKKSGVNAVGCWIELIFVQEDFSYGFALRNYQHGTPFFRKLYHEKLSKDDRNFILDTVQNFLLEDLERRIDNLAN